MKAMKPLDVGHFYNKERKELTGHVDLRGLLVGMNESWVPGPPKSFSFDLPLKMMG